MSDRVLEQLGFEAEDRVVIVDADDIAMCHAANLAFWEDHTVGLVTSGAAMMPCPWTPELADYQTFLRPELKAHIAAQGIHLIGYRRLRDLIRSP